DRVPSRGIARYGLRRSGVRPPNSGLRSNLGRANLPQMPRHWDWPENLARRVAANLREGALLAAARARRKHSPSDSRRWRGQTSAGPSWESRSRFWPSHVLWALRRRLSATTNVAPSTL